MEEKLRKIKAFAFDVDGVLTDGGLLADLNGEFYRVFDAKDGMALRMASMQGYGFAAQRFLPPASPE
jgi:3-deoxy-D-manno-octulosonate 8-phosphate phosphatase (KDO 8-P phosphatase)